MALTLREWTMAGFHTRDFCEFPILFRSEAPTVDAAALRDAIALAAYHRYLARGKESGREMEDWLAAERELLGRG
jgi:hypothetical protein